MNKAPKARKGPLRHTILPQKNRPVFETGRKWHQPFVFFFMRSAENTHTAADAAMSTASISVGVASPVAGGKEGAAGMRMLGEEGRIGLEGLVGLVGVSGTYAGILMGENVVAGRMGTLLWKSACVSILY